MPTARADVLMSGMRRLRSQHRRRSDGGRRIQGEVGRGIEIHVARGLLQVSHLSAAAR